MKKKIITVFVLTFIAVSLQAQQPEPQKPVKTGNEWKMPASIYVRV